MTPDTAPQKEEPVEPNRKDIDPQDEQAAVDPALFEEKPIAPPFERTVLTTPLHLVTSLESRTNRWTDWNGYTVPEVLTGLGDEYRALRGAAALMDVSPLVKYRIAGRDAFAFLQRLVTRDIENLGVHRAVHVILCESRGLVLGDGLLFRLADDEYRLVTEETHLAWLMDSSEGFRVRIEDVSATLGTLSLQGPLSAFVLMQAGVGDVASLAPFAARWVPIAGMPVYLSRTGTSGDLGYELWSDAEDAPHVWRWLVERGGPLGLRPAGFALRELARLEAGLPRAGQDYLSAFAAIDARDALPPAAIWASPALDLDKGLFNGRAALRRRLDEPLARRVVSLAIEGLEPLRFSALSREGRIVGAATSTGFSPALGANIALAAIDAEAAAAGGLLAAAERRDGLSVRETLASVRVLAHPARAHPRRFTVPAPLRP